MTRARDLSNFIGSGSFSSTTFTATAGQTAFTIAHTQGFVQVFMNGLLLDLTTDYTSNGSAITLTSAAVAGDEIEVVKYDAFSVGDAVPASGGTFTGNVNIPGHVVQVVQATFNTKTDINSSGSYSNTHITTNITPSSTSNKVLVLINTVASVDATTTTFRKLKVGRNGTVVSTEKILRSSYANTSGSDVEDLTIHYLDSPSSTSSVTYSLMADAAGQGMAVGGRMSSVSANQISSITLMEIAQ
tara:strand:- start:462 stop:1193 length:732 start_codon:yes stop_codon:yes gene_type:complete